MHIIADIAISYVHLHHNYMSWSGSAILPLTAWSGCGINQVAINSWQLCYALASIIDKEHVVPLLGLTS